MSILINKTTSYLSGFSVVSGLFHSEQAIAYGTKMVPAGVTPVKGGTTHPTVYLFLHSSAVKAWQATGATASVIMYLRFL